MERVLNNDIGVHFYEGPRDEEGYIFTIAKRGTAFPFKSESIESFVNKGQNTAEFTLFEAVKADPDPDRVSQDYRQCVTLEFSLGKKVKDETEVSFEITIDRNGRLQAKLKDMEKTRSKTMQLTETSWVDEIEKESRKVHEALGDVRYDADDGSVGWDRDPHLAEDENEDVKRLRKWLTMNDEILRGLKENRDKEDGQVRRYSLPDVLNEDDDFENETEAEKLLERMDGLISRGLDHATGQRKRKLERAHNRA